MYHPGVLPGRNVRMRRKSTREKTLLRPQAGLLEPCSNGAPGWLGQFKLYGSLGLLLNNQRPWQYLIAVSNVANFQTDEVAAAQLAIDGQVEQSEITDGVGVLEVDPRMSPSRKAHYDASRSVTCSSKCATKRVSLDSERWSCRYTI